ncbi:AAA family ATPase [Ferruginibacter paludis]|uniref:AAA family ATPase n=1 Tax=Ferruginibacter paludis TaxID=1310417 RepID=UPI0025B3D468|nr:AAA family ATPase [Ferruginibacter paludis]MDN3658691.1 AAA family ATPase [Ferruginibacter paludis]
MLKKVVIIGPESTGKSTLCAKLSAHFKSEWVKEYAREYLIANGTYYTFENLLEVAQGQIDREEFAIQKMPHFEDKKSPGILFIDTDMYVMKVWCEFVFNQCHHWILNKIVERKYDLYLLCNIDQPWIKDELREYPDLVTREKLYHYYKDIMINQQVPWVDISGNYEKRLEEAIAAVNELHN